MKTANEKDRIARFIQLVRELHLSNAELRRLLGENGLVEPSRSSLTNWLSGDRPPSGPLLAFVVLLRQVRMLELRVADYRQELARLGHPVPPPAE